MLDEEKLFNDFPPVSTEEWENVINQDLKGADYEKKLIWKTADGFKVRPYYRSEDLDNLTFLDALPNEFPFVRGYEKNNNQWKIYQKIGEKNPQKANEIAKESVEKGANILLFSAQEVVRFEHIEILLHSLPLEQCELRFKDIEDPIQLTQFLIKYIENHNYNKTNVQISLEIDLITQIVIGKENISHLDEKIELIFQLFELTKDFSHFKVIHIESNALHERGATIVQEVGYGLAFANEYIALLMEKGLSVDEIVPKMQLSLSVGSNYFMEIAKFRAIRMLWATLILQYQPKDKKSYQLSIYAIGSQRNKTIYDPYVNILRSTTEGMAAALGGADAIYLQSLDQPYKEDDSFSRRISRNIQIILKEEAFFDKVIDPAAGSYYVENLTHSIAIHAWNLFKESVKNSGIIPLIENGTIRSAIEESRKNREKELATRKATLVGTNQYPNIKEEMESAIQQTTSSEETSLPIYREAALFEDTRLVTENFAKKEHRIKVFLLKVGNVAFRQARAGFTTNFFGCAGFDIMDNSGFDNVNDGVTAALENRADIVVICSSDEEYATLGVEATLLLKKSSLRPIIVVAGNPTDSIEALTKAGVDDFIHIRTNILDSLKEFQVKLKMR